MQKFLLIVEPKAENYTSLYKFGLTNQTLELVLRHRYQKDYNLITNECTNDLDYLQMEKNRKHKYLSRIFICIY